MNECPLGFDCDKCRWFIYQNCGYECAFVILTESIVNLKEVWGRSGGQNEHD
jgi:hypothetical protein